MTNTLFPPTNKPIKLYGFEISGHSHRVQLMLSLLDLPYELVPVNLKENEHKTQDHHAIHPFGQVPVMNDNGTSLWESNAILVYLAAKYDEARDWLPDDPVKMANVQKWLSVAAGPLVQGPVAARASKLFGHAVDYEEAHNKTHMLLDIVEIELQRTPFICTEHATIADVALYTYIAHAPEGGIDLAPYPGVIEWLRKIEALDGFVPMKQIGG
jgi:glutathione S-transferase